jgi:hypothetical protein
MCIVIAKHFDKYGWVGIKNRDRNYIPEISFRKEHHDNLEILYFWDDITQYCEGFNSNGISVLSASLMVRDDEKEIEKRSSTPSKDGIKIKNSLRHHTIHDVVQNLINDKLTGNTIIFDKDHMFLLEGAWKKGRYKQGDFDYIITEISKDHTVVRTNHGIELSWAGYQRDDSSSHTMSRISSESRKQIAEFVTDNADDPFEILDGLTKDFTGNGQLNALRTTNETKKMRTTSQICIIPSEKVMLVRPVQSHITYNFWELNNKDSQTWVEILSNRILHTNENKHSTFLQKLKHII